MQLGRTVSPASQPSTFVPFQGNAPAPSGGGSGSITLPTQVLRKGERGAAVNTLQQALVKVGVMSREKHQTGPGIFGPGTEAALKAFQKQFGLKDDGVYGPRTRVALQQALRGEEPPPPPEVKKPPVVWKASPNHDSRRGTDVDSIVLHHTASNDGKKDLNTLTNPRSGVSCHYLVDRDGTIYQLVADGRRAWHAGRSALHGVPTDMNARSIGIEIVNRGDGKTPFTEAQYRALEQLVPWLAKTHDVPMRNLVGHKDVAIPPGRKSDPAENFDFNRIRRATDRVV